MSVSVRPMYACHWLSFTSSLLAFWQAWIHSIDDAAIVVIATQRIGIAANTAGVIWPLILHRTAAPLARLAYLEMVLLTERFYIFRTSLDRRFRSVARHRPTFAPFRDGWLWRAFGAGCKCIKLIFLRCWCFLPRLVHLAVACIATRKVSIGAIIRPPVLEFVVLFVPCRRCVEWLAVAVFWRAQHLCLSVGPIVASALVG